MAEADLSLLSAIGLMTPEVPSKLGVNPSSRICGLLPHFKLETVRDFLVKPDCTFNQSSNLSSKG
uniref:Uncharacterized protein n=1 Tax=Rhizophora mucronata TaxID=61149 RepID=A0A2P2J0C8_RHIMU